MHLFSFVFVISRCLHFSLHSVDLRHSLFLVNRSPCVRSNAIGFGACLRWWRLIIPIMK